MVCDYVVARTETVHLMRQDAWGTGHLVTLCGRPVGQVWEFGDETESGIAATCKTCHTLIRKG